MTAGYVEVGGQQVWHEVTGGGPPVVLLHGAFGGADSFTAQTSVFAAAGYGVHVPERRGHAHTADVPGPLTYQVMADDTVAYLAQETGRAHLVGWSDGAVVAMLVAMQRPDLVDRVVLIGQYYNSSGKPPSSFAMLELMEDPEVKGFLRQAYDPHSPDGPEHFDVVHAKTMQMVRTEPEIPLADIATVAAPTLVLVGDRDEVTVAHSQQVAETLPEGRLAVLPGTHLLPIESPESVNAVVLAWLARQSHHEGADDGGTAGQ